ncbi:Sterile alpha motif domain-containing protein isoform 2 [Hibiscus syriacus]|uniref:Sterile alpha motif domain-containing protein isoform 2 n=1 Tax=Hibiscus syriacus TaxID=106335 RepID=A0A6A2XMU2_HIBSY|nr:ankyrin repeat and SAM domain-containing protein 6-like isoform X3 [Hibiscus syriacus]KAE8671160.1 Sterile alpha motif domain-containing protein isoform 2 [Hibiscus syriacus]
MYADQLEGAGKRSVKDRLNGNSFNNSIPRRQTTGKRQRQDEKWEHDLYHDDVPQVSNRKVNAQDLRLKLQRKSLQQVSQSGRAAFSGVRDLRDKLSGTMNLQPVNVDPPKLKSDVNKPARRSVAVETSEPEPKKAATMATKKKAQQKVDASVEGFLQSLSLEKYAITFQVEEVDMTALVQMTDDDLKALGIPMGPRKKIILALESRG